MLKKVKETQAKLVDRFKSKARIDQNTIKTTVKRLNSSDILFLADLINKDFVHIEVKRSGTGTTILASV